LKRRTHIFPQPPVGPHAINIPERKKNENTTAKIVLANIMSPS
jgi:hypothetical protein